MRKLIIILMVSAGFTVVTFSQNFTISGYVHNAESGETLLNSSIIETNTGKGTVTNNYGFYSITIPGGNVQLQFSYIGFTAYQESFWLKKDTILNVSLFESTELEEITVIGHQKQFGVKGSLMSAIEVPMNLIKTVPTLFGETDVLKTLQLLPGVQAGTEGSSGFYVRGGGPDENLYLLDGVAVYNVNHIAGFFSVFNSDAVKNVTLYKGGFPARFGGRLSSVIDVRMNDGNNQQLHGNVSIGLISSKFNLEGPIFSNKTTFNISARRSYFDLLTKPLFHLVESDDGFKATAGYYFYDFNLKLSHTFSETDRLFLSHYTGRDVLNSEIQDNYTNTINLKEDGKIKIAWDWGNVISALRWNHIINNKLFLNTAATYTGYRFNTLMGNELTTTSINPPSVTNQSTLLGYKSGINDLGLKADVDFTPSPNHTIKFGSSYTFHTFRPGITVDRSKIDDNNSTSVVDTVFDNFDIKTHEAVVYFENDIRLNSFLKANIGLNYTSYFVQESFYNSLQPRVSLRALLTDKLSVKAAFASMSQYVHLLSYNNFSLPNDLWVPVTRRIEPMKSLQYTTGFFYTLKNIIDLSVESYYKSMNNLIEYMDGATFFGSGSGWENKVVLGRGWAYGIEFLAQKSIGKTTGWVGYTWSTSERLFNRDHQELNNGEVFPAKYDRRNDLSIVIAHVFTNKIDISGSLKYCTGNNVTLSFQNYKGFNEFDGKIPYFGKRNNYRMPDYFRIDAGVNFRKKLKNGSRIFNISVYNLTNQMNAFYLFSSSKKYNDPVTGKLVSERLFNKITVFPIIPSVNYTYKF